LDYQEKIESMEGSIDQERFWRPFKDIGFGLSMEIE
jgi:hypothetical protein